MNWRAAARDTIMVLLSAAAMALGLYMEGCLK